MLKERPKAGSNLRPFIACQICLRYGVRSHLQINPKLEKLHLENFHGGEAYKTIVAIHILGTQ